MPSGGFFDKILDSIPGYKGYRDKESRRDTDRAIRDALVVEYGQLADRLGRLATDLANQRKIAAISLVDRPHKRLMQFIDRVRTASYGYAPIFANDKVDAKALDQIARFDEALNDQVPVLETQIEELERLDSGSEQFKAATEKISQTLQGLDDRFDKRSEVIHSGSALPEKDLTILLDKPKIATIPRAYRLHEGEAVAYQGTNYSIIGRVSLEGEGEAWRAFQLDGGSGDRWLQVSALAGDPLYWLKRTTPAGEIGSSRVSVGSDSYNLVKQLSGDGEVIGKQGKSGMQPVLYYHYQSSDGSSHIHVFRLGSTYLSLVGTVVDPLEVELYSREQ